MTNSKLSSFDLYLSRLPFPAFSDLDQAEQLHRVSIARSERLTYKRIEKKPRKKAAAKSKANSKFSRSRSTKINNASKALANLSPEQIEKLKSQLNL